MHGKTRKVIHLLFQRRLWSAASVWRPFAIRRALLVAAAAAILVAAAWSGLAPDDENLIDILRTVVVIGMAVLILAAYGYTRLACPRCKVRFFDQGLWGYRTEADQCSGCGLMLWSTEGINRK